MSKNVFEPVTVVETVVYDREGKEIVRLEGRKEIRAKEYEEHLPVEYRIVETTTRVIAKARLEKA